MRKHLFYLLATVALVATGCADDKMNGSFDGGDDAYGRIQIVAEGDATILSRANITAPSTDEFSLRITGTEYEGRWSTIADFKQSDPLFKEGDYTAFVTYGNSKAEGANLPCFGGEQSFTVTARQRAKVTINAQITNSQAVVRTTESFRNYFHDATFTLKTGSGNTFTFTPTADNSEEPVFVQAGTSITVTGKAYHQTQTGSDNGKEASFSTSLVTTKARTCHSFTFDAKDAGSATVTIVLNENEEIKENLDIEINDDAISDKQ